MRWSGMLVTPSKPVYNRYAISGHGDVKALIGSVMAIGSGSEATDVIFDEDQTTILAIYSGRRSSTTYRRN